MNTKIKKAVGTSVLSLGLVVGLAGFAGATSGSIGNTGPDSTNKVEYKDSSHVDVDNNNSLGLNNSNSQSASSGDASAKHNTTAGDAMSGDAMNDNSVDATVEVDNSSAGSAALAGNTGSGDLNATIDTTGPDSYNKVEYSNKSTVDVTNNNNVNVSNSNSQSASSGNAKVYDNTTGGSATSGSVSNTSSSTFTIRVTN